MTWEWVVLILGIFSLAILLQGVKAWHEVQMAEAKRIRTLFGSHSSKEQIEEMSRTDG